MTNWSYEFDFGDFITGAGWYDWHCNNTFCEFIPEQGWKSGHQESGGYDEQRISIRRLFEKQTTITKIEVTYTGTFVDQVREKQNLFGQLYLDNTLVVTVITDDLTDGTHVASLNYASVVCNRIDLMMQCEAGYSPQQGGAIITKVVLYGTGISPFSVSSTDWCQEFNFAEYGDGEWENFHHNGTTCAFVQNQGWVSGWQQGGNEDEQRISIRKVLAQPTSIERIEVTYDGDFVDQLR